jgi:hypothetical protein
MFHCRVKEKQNSINREGNTLQSNPYTKEYYHKLGLKLKGYYPYFGVQPFTFPSKYFATLQNGRGNFL